MPVALAPIIVAIGGAVGVTITAGTASIIAGVGLAAIGVGVSFLASSLLRPKQPKPSDGQTIIKQSAAPRFRLYGRGKVGGILAFANTEGGNLHRVLAMGSGEIDAVEEHWIDDELVTLDGSNDVQEAKYIKGGTPRVHIEFRLGTDSPAVYSDVNTAFPALWTTDHLGKGIPSAYVRTRQVDAESIMEMFPNLANTAYRQVQRGAKVPDIGGSPLALLTSTWSDSAARVILDYLTHPDGLGLDQSWIENELESWAQAIADCDDEIELKADGSPGGSPGSPATEPRYRIWNAYRFDERPADVLNRFLQACDGVLFPTPNRGLALKVGKWEAPTVTVDDDAIIAFSEIGRGRDVLSTANTVRAQFTSPDHDYQETDAQPWIDADDVAARGEYATDIELYAVPSHAQARRLMKLAAHRANPNWVGTLTCNLRALPVLGERFITVTLTELGINETFEVLGTEFLIEEGSILAGVRIRVASLSSAAYDWDAETEEGEAPDTGGEIDPDDQVPVPTGFTVTFHEDHYHASWDAAAVDWVQAEIQFREVGETAWQTGPTITIGENEVDLHGILVEHVYEFRLRFRSTATGRVSDWTDSVFQSYDWEAETGPLVATFTTTPDATRMGLYNALIGDLKTAAVWDNLDVLYVLAAHDSQAARTNLKSPGTLDLEAVGTLTFTADQGFTGDGSTGFLRLATTLSGLGGYAQDSAHAGVWIRAAGATLNQTVAGREGTSGTLLYFLRPSTGTQFAAQMNSATGSILGANTDNVGHYLANRSGATAVQGYKNGALLGSDNEASEDISTSTANIAILRNNNNHADDQVIFYHMGVSLTATEATDLYAALNAYKTGVGA